MRSNSTVSLRGDIDITVRDSAGRVVQTQAVKNKIVSTGLSAVSRLLAQTSGVTVANYKLAQLRVGTATTPAASGQTDLVAAVLSNGSYTLTNSDVVPTGNTVVVKATVPAAIASDITLREVGLFLANGELFARQTHSGITTGTGLSIEYTWTLTFTAA